MKNAPTPHAKALEAFDQWAEGWRRDAGLPGLGVSVRDREGNLIFSKAYGVQDQATGTALPTDALYQIASQSKIITATAIHQLIADGKINKETGRPLSLQDPLTDLLPNFKGAEWLNDEATGKPVTLADALAHKTRFGRGDYKKEWVERKQLPSFDELRTVGAKDIDPANDKGYQPEAGPGYSNRAYNFMGVIIEDTANMPFNKYIQEEIVRRHALGEIYPDLSGIPKEKQSRVATGYTGKHYDKPTGHADALGTTPSGGFYATSEAMSGFIHKLTKGDILAGHKVDKSGPIGMFEAHGTDSTGYRGLGTHTASVVPEFDMTGVKENYYHVPQGKGDLYGHSGGTEGFQSDTVYHSETGLTISTYRTGYWVPSYKEEPDDNEFEKKVDADNKTRSTSKVIASILKAITGTGEFSPKQPSKPTPDVDAIYDAHLAAIHAANPVSDTANSEADRVTRKRELRPKKLKM